MIRYTLACDKRHTFESWFANSAAYDKQAKRGLVTCPHCGSPKVEKALMAPQLSRTDRQKTPRAKPKPPASAPADTLAATEPVAIMSAQEKEFRTKLRELRDMMTSNAQDVGNKFSEEARKMHYGESEARSIYGEASLDDAKALHDEGIEFVPLPSLPDERN